MDESTVATKNVEKENAPQQPTANGDRPLNRTEKRRHRSRGENSRAAANEFSEHPGTSEARAFAVLRAFVNHWTVPHCVGSV